MFDPIQGPPDTYSGPSVGLSTEKGDSWHTAVSKINAGFSNIVKAIENGVHHFVEAIDSEARTRITALEETVAGLQMRLDAFTTPGYPPINLVVGVEGEPAQAGDAASETDPANPAAKPEQPAS